MHYCDTCDEKTNTGYNDECMVCENTKDIRMNNKNSSRQEVKFSNGKVFKVGDVIAQSLKGSTLETILGIGSLKVFTSYHSALGAPGESTMLLQTLESHYKVVKPEPKTEILYEYVDIGGTLRFFFEDGRYPKFKEKAKSTAIFKDNVKRRTGRTLKLNMDTWEIVVQ